MKELHDQEVKHILEKIYARRTFGIKPGLQIAGGLLAGLGNPQDSYASIHVAGTNGKGSVCAFLDAILRAAGIRTGLYTSPHLIRFNERIRVDGVEIEDTDIAALGRLIDPVSDDVARRSGQEPTFFEYTTAMAFRYFSDKGVGMAVIETGMGGRLDATNLVTPAVSVITGISLEHSAYLGDTIAAIAGEKAGIIKKGVPLVCGMMDDEALNVIRRKALEMDAPVIMASEHVAVDILARSLSVQKLGLTSRANSYGTVECHLTGEFQAVNAAIAIAAAEVFFGNAGADLPVECVRAGIAGAKWPGRFNLVHDDPPIVVDGAHNPDAALELASSIRKYFGGMKVFLVSGMCSDKDAASFYRGLQGVLSGCILVPISDGRCMPMENLRHAAGYAGCPVDVFSDVQAGLAAAVREAKDAGGAVVVAGSLFLAGEVLALSGIGKGVSGNE